MGLDVFLAQTIYIFMLRTIRLVRGVVQNVLVADVPFRQTIST